MTVSTTALRETPPGQTPGGVSVCVLNDSRPFCADRQDSAVTRELSRRLGAESFLQYENGISHGRLHALQQSAVRDGEAGSGADRGTVPGTALDRQRNRVYQPPQALRAVLLAALLVLSAISASPEGEVTGDGRGWSR